MFKKIIIMIIGVREEKSVTKYIVVAMKCKTAAQKTTLLRVAH